MFDIKTTELLITFITKVIAYTICTTLAGFIQALAAKKLGDTSPEVEEFLTFDPLEHVDLVGMLCFIFLGVGWGKYLHINPASIQGRFRLFVAFLSKSFSYIVIAFISLLVLLRIFGETILDTVMRMVLFESVSLTTLSKIYPQTSSFVLALAIIMVMLVYIGVLFAVLDFIIGSFRFAMITFLKNLSQSPEGDLLTFFIPLLMMIALSGPLRLLVIYVISHCAYFLAPLIGAS